MNDQQWAVVIGFAVAVGLRAIDLLLPRGRVIRWIWTRTVAVDDDLSPQHRQDAADDADLDVQRRQVDRTTDADRRDRDRTDDDEERR